MPGMRIQIEPPLGLMVPCHLSVFLTEYDILNVQVKITLQFILSVIVVIIPSILMTKETFWKVFMNSKDRGNALLSLT